MSSANKFIEHTSPQERNEMRIRRMDTWIKLADAAEDKHVKFVFYWIAFEAGYLRQGANWNSPKGSSGYDAFFSKISKVGCDVLQGVMKQHQHTQTAEDLFELRWASDRFWYRNRWWDEIMRKKCRLLSGRQQAWESKFKSHVQSLKQKWRNAADKGDGASIKIALVELFDILKVVRHQIVHGGSAGDDSYGKSQVEWGAELLGVLVPLFHKIIDAHRDIDLGIPPFPRLPTVTKPDQPDHSPPWLLNDNLDIKTRRR